MTEIERQEKIRIARIRHGKPFITERKIKRQTEKSYLLKKLEGAGETNIHTMHKRAQK